MATFNADYLVVAGGGAVTVRAAGRAHHHLAVEEVGVSGAGRIRCGGE